jgi:hypothetical protein
MTSSTGGWGVSILTRQCVLGAGGWRLRCCVQHSVPVSMCLSGLHNVGLLGQLGVVATWHVQQHHCLCLGCVLMQA